MRLSRTVPVFAALILLAGCSRPPRIDIQTFEVRYLDEERLSQLIHPYIFFDREGAPGTYSLSGNVLTVRETPDNLSRIRAVLNEYDVKKPSILLHVDIIEANGGGIDSSFEDIKDIYDRLIELFKFEGYARVAGGVLSTMEGKHVSHSMGADRARGGIYQFFAACGRLYQEDGKWVLYVEMELLSAGPTLLSTSALLREGQTTLVGTSSTGDVKAVILAVRPEIVN